MDFFQEQENARRRSRFLVVWFVLAVIGIVAAVYGVAMAITQVFMKRGGGSGVESLWDPQTMLATSGVTLAIIFCSTGYKMIRLLRGGEAIALDLGGRRLSSDTTDTDERRLLNVVEEMAIASGAPVPDVYLLEQEDSINAFAAGRDTSDAVIGVTRGAIRRLTRDELQGVVAHEFSHILNGDMKMNLRMVGLLFGILSIALLGQVLMQVGFRAGRHVRMGRDGREGVSIATVMLVVGVALYVVGYVGVFFAHLIKASVSRQREFLADASAVQFTRNPDGIGGALRKIGGHVSGSRVMHPLAEEASHMFFGNALGRGFTGRMFASHPPLPERIKKVLPHWKGDFEETELPEVSRGMRNRGTQKKAKRAARRRARSREREKDGEDDGFGGFLGGFGVGSEVMVSGLSGPVGIARGPQGEHLELAQEIHRSLPREWLRHVRQSGGAQTIVFALLLGQDHRVKEAELAALAAEVDRVAYDETVELSAEFAGIPSVSKLALVDLAIPALRRMSPVEYERFLIITEKLIRADGQIDLFEFALRKIFRRHLNRHFHRKPASKVKYDRAEALATETSIILSTCVGLANDSLEDRKRAFAGAIRGLQAEWPQLRLEFMGPAHCGLDRIDESLDRWDQAAPLLKKQLLLACAAAISRDGRIGDHEAELVRAVADAIDEPLPPMLGEKMKVEG